MEVVEHLFRSLRREPSSPACWCCRGSRSRYSSLGAGGDGGRSWLCGDQRLPVDVRGALFRGCRGPSGVRSAGGRWWRCALGVRGPAFCCGGTSLYARGHTDRGGSGRWRCRPGADSSLCTRTGRFGSRGHGVTARRHGCTTVLRHDWVAGCRAVGVDWVRLRCWSRSSRWASRCQHDCSADWRAWTVQPRR